MAKTQRKPEKELMKSYTVRMHPELMKKLREKAGLIPVSTVIRRLIEKYIKGEVGLD